MDVVLIFNGLGNQMSQYAFYLAKKRYNKNTTCIYYNSIAQHNGFELDRLFGIILPQGKRENQYYIIFKELIKQSIYIKVIRKLLNLFHIISINSENINYHFDQRKLIKGKALLNFYFGGWHSYKYVEIVEKEIKSLFVFNQKLIMHKNISLGTKMLCTKSVSVHIRRGDYLKKENRLWGGVADFSYYEKALALLNTTDEYQFYFFSDDIEWAKQNFHLKNMIFIDWNTAELSWQDMYLISNCRININPNSTFSWWASWLNCNLNNTIIVPDRFVLNVQSIDFYPVNWNQIG